jgi:hypothetical protein
MDGTILGQGSFVVPSTIVNQVIAIPSGVDWMNVYNYTQYGAIGTPTANTGLKYYWQRGMAPGTGIVEYGASTFQTLSADTLASGGFTLYDPSGQTSGALPFLGVPEATSAITNVTRPVVSTSSTAGVSVGSIVRIWSPVVASGGEVIGSLGGVDFSVGAVTANTSFELTGNAGAALANAVGSTTGTGLYAVVNYSPLFYPRNRVITNITKAVNAVVSTSVPHGMTPGQEIRFNIPYTSGMTQLNPQLNNNGFPQGNSSNAIVISVTDDWSFVININTLNYTTFTFPTVAQGATTLPQMIPFGEDTATSLSVLGSQVPMAAGLQIYNTNTGLLADSTVNTGVLGMILGTGGLGTKVGAAISGPAGSVAGDVMYWTTGKSSFGGL